MVPRCVPMVIPYTHHICQAKYRQENATRKLTAKYKSQQRHCHHSCPMNSGFGHPYKDRYQQEEQKFVWRKCKTEKLDQGLCLTSKILPITRFRNQNLLFGST